MDLERNGIELAMLSLRVKLSLKVKNELEEGTLRIAVGSPSFRGIPTWPTPPHPERPLAPYAQALAVGRSTAHLAGERYLYCPDCGYEKPTRGLVLRSCN